MQTSVEVAIIGGSQIIRTQQGLPTFTPDDNPLVGPVPGLEGLFVACGWCTPRIPLSPAIGRIMADNELASEHGVHPHQVSEK